MKSDEKVHYYTPSGKLLQLPLRVDRKAMLAEGYVLVRDPEADKAAQKRFTLFAK